MQKTIAFGLAAAAALLGGVVAANAELQVTGSADDMVVHAKSATLADVVAGLATTSHALIEVKGATARQFTGTYSGPLPKVLSRLLAGIDHVVHVAPDRITIVLVTADAARRTAQSYDSGTGVQGWVPSAHEVAALATKPQAQAVQADPASDDPAPAPSAVQGWMPSAGQVATIAAAPRTQALPAPGQAIVSDTDEAPPSGVQGWVPTVVAAAQPSSAAAAPSAGAPQPLPIATDDGPIGGVQGWVPTAANADRR